MDSDNSNLYKTFKMSVSILKCFCFSEYFCYSLAAYYYPFYETCYDSDIPLLYLIINDYSFNVLIVKPESSDTLKMLLQSISKYAKDSDKQLILIITEEETSIKSATILQGIGMRNIFTINVMFLYCVKIRYLKKHKI